MSEPKRPGAGLGNEGFCDHCQRWNPPGPDVCLGYLRFVSWACCGHGVVDEYRPYVVIGGRPNEGCEDRRFLGLKGRAAWIALRILCLLPRIVATPDEEARR